MTTTEPVTATQVYQLYIKASPEQVWDAITNPEMVAKFFHGAQIESTYEVGTKSVASRPTGASWGTTTRSWSATRPGGSCSPGGACTTQRWRWSRRAGLRGRSRANREAFPSSLWSTIGSRAPPRPPLASKDGRTSSATSRR